MKFETYLDGLRASLAGKLKEIYKANNVMGKSR